MGNCLGSQQTAVQRLEVIESVRPPRTQGPILYVASPTSYTAYAYPPVPAYAYPPVPAPSAPPEGL